MNAIVGVKVAKKMVKKNKKEWGEPTQYMIRIKTTSTATDRGNKGAVGID